MQISLLENEVELILKSIEKNTFWIANSIRKKIKSGKELSEKRANCKHVEGEYEGKQTCCVKCGGVWKEGQGTSWSLKQEKDIYNIGLIGELKNEKN